MNSTSISRVVLRAVKAYGRGLKRFADEGYLHTEDGNHTLTLH